MARTHVHTYIETWIIASAFFKKHRASIMTTESVAPTLFLFGHLFLLGHHLQQKLREIYPTRVRRAKFVFTM